MWLLYWGVICAFHVTTLTDVLLMSAALALHSAVLACKISTPGGLSQKAWYKFCFRNGAGKVDLCWLAWHSVNPLCAAADG